MKHDARTTRASATRTAAVTRLAAARLAAGLATALVALALAPALAAAANESLAVPVPLPAGASSDTYWGVTVPDPYRALENVADPQVQQWMRGQADATTAILARIPGRDALLARLRELDAQSPGAVSRVQRTPAGRLFILRRQPEDNQFKLVWRDGVGGAERVFVDTEAVSKAQGRPHAIVDYAASPDGRHVAYSLQVSGSEIGKLHVVEVATGRAVVDAVDGIRFASPSWLDDGSGLFYSRLRDGFDKLPPGEKFGDRTRWFVSLKTGRHQAVFSASRFADLGLPTYANGVVFQVPGSTLAANVVNLGVERNQLLYVAPLADVLAGKARWRKVLGLDDQASSIALTRDHAYFRSSIDAPRFKVMRIALAVQGERPAGVRAGGAAGRAEGPVAARAETLIPAGSAVNVAVAAARDAAYVTQRRGATLALLRVPHATGKAEEVALPFEGNVALLDTDARLDGTVMSLGGWTRASKPYAYDLRQRKVAALDLVRPGKLDAPAGIEAREATVRSHDGVEVPVSILARKGLPLDGNNPTIVYGYGAYGVTENPIFNPRVYAWLERGGVYVVAHVRGGGAFGHEWHQAGRKTTKPNTWKDAIAVTEWLIANRVASPARVGIYGGSAGGILVGRAITERPDLFAAAVPAVGVMDMVRTETTANGVGNVPEFGTVKNEEEFRALLAMSSYHHVNDGVRYPATLLVHGVNDTRVDVWQSAKFASRLAAATVGGKPVLMRLDYELGHGQGGTRDQQVRQTADVWSFFLWQFGVAGFQPKP